MLVRVCRAAAGWLVASSFFLMLVVVLSVQAHAQDAPQKANSPAGDGPHDPRAAKTFQNAVQWQQKGNKEAALDAFRKAFKQDNGQCPLCLSRAFSLAMSIGAYKDAEQIAQQWLPLANSDADRGAVHYGLGISLQEQGLLDKKDKYFAESRDEFQKALALKPALSQAEYGLGISLAYLHQDDEARAAFSRFLDKDTKMPVLHDRAERFVDRIELARARMAPAFSLTTLDGQRISMDGLAGKVVLIDFWATWCGPCREALPHVRNIVHRFAGQPLVVLSVSLDIEDGRWRDFVAKNDMTWLQYRDSGFNSRMAKLFNVTAIPATFSIDADGVLEDQHVGDADIERKLKKMIARAVAEANQKPAPAKTPAGAQ